MEVVTRSLFVSSLATPPPPRHPSLPPLSLLPPLPSFLPSQLPSPPWHQLPAPLRWMVTHPQPQSPSSVLFPVPEAPSLPTIPILLWFLVFPLPSPGIQALSQEPVLRFWVLVPTHLLTPSPNPVYLLLPSSSVPTWVPLPSTPFPSNLSSSSSSLSPSFADHHVLPFVIASLRPLPSPPRPQSLAHTLGCQSIRGTLFFQRPPSVLPGGTCGSSSAPSCSQTAPYPQPWSSQVTAKC